MKNEKELEKNNINKNYYFIKIFLCSFISLLLIELLFKGFSFKLVDISLIRIILFTLSTSLIISYIATFFKPLVTKIIVATFNFLMALYAIIQLSFKSFMGNFMSFGMLKDGDVGRISGEVSTFIRSINLYHLLIFLPVLLIIVIFVIKKDWFVYEKRNCKSNVLLTIIVVLVHLIGLASLELKVLDSPLQIKTVKQLYYNPNLFDASLKNIGSTRFLFRDVINLFKDNEEIVEITKPNEPEQPVVVEPDYERVIDDTAWNELMSNEDNKIIKNLHEFYINQNITQKNEYTGLFKDKNLILIMVEAFDMAAINPEITPTLYKLSKEGWYFDNYYAPKYSCTTGESEFIALTSIIPSNSVCTPHAYVNNTYSQSIFNLFNDSGYTSTSYHGWSDQYYPRTKLHKNMGSTFYNSTSLGFSTSGGWTSDLSLMEKSYEIFSESDKYFSFLITVSMHFSYDFSDATVRKNWDMVKDLDTGVSMQRYLAKAIEFDLSLEYLLKTLEEDGTLDDTVIVLFGDHHPYNLDFDYLNDFSSVDRYQDLNEDLMPFIIYNSATEPMTVSKTASTFDILPTLANLFDLNYDPRYYTGKDIFSDEETRVIFPNGSWVTDNAVYFASSGQYKLKGNVDEDYIKNTNEIISNWFTISNNTLEKDYFKYR